MITGWGVAEAVRHFYDFWGPNFSYKRAIIQGWGNVAAAAAYYLAEMNVMVVGIIDRDGGVINNKGFSKDEIKTLKQFRNQLIGIGNNMFNVANPQHSGGNATEWTHMREELSEFY